MPTLKMEVDNVRYFQTALSNEQQMLLQEIANLKSMEDTVIGSYWQGNSALEFHSQFTEIMESMLQALERLEQLNRRLNNEIYQWETTAASLG